MCPAYYENVAATSAEGSEVSKFKAGPLFQKLLLDVSRRLGFSSSLDPDEIQAIFDVCRYEQSWELDRASAWCSVRILCVQFLQHVFNVCNISFLICNRLSHNLK